MAHEKKLSHIQYFEAFTKFNLNSFRNMKKLELQQMESLQGGKNGQNTLDCFNDVYTNHGWASVGAILAAVAYSPSTLMFLSACAGRNRFS